MTTQDNPTDFEKLVALHTEATNTLIRDLQIELLEPETATSKSGRAMTYMIWQYRNPQVEGSAWKTRKSLMTSKETKTLLAHGPYEQDALYRVTAQKIAKGYWQWTAIEKLASPTHVSNEE